jgi:hypothetical protein
VEKLFKELPSSSEQIIHPNKNKQDQPTPLSLPQWQDKKNTSKLILESSFGEAFLLSKLLGMNVAREEALKSASGWDGDIAQIYKLSDGAEILVWRILFDRIIDAQQLESAVHTYVKPKELFRVGRVVDWIIGEDTELTTKLRIFLNKNSLFVEPNLADERSTAAQEISIKNDAKSLFTPYVQSKIIIGPNLGADRL